MDPNKIRVETRHYSLRDIIEMLDSGELRHIPGFYFRSWHCGDKHRFIESTMLQIPLTPLIFMMKKDGSMKVADGKQRVKTMEQFLKGRFKMGHSRYFDDFEGKTFDDLTDEQKKAIKKTLFPVYVIYPQTKSHRIADDILARLGG